MVKFWKSSLLFALLAISAVFSTRTYSEEAPYEWEPSIQLSHGWLGGYFGGRSLWLWDDTAAVCFGKKAKLWYGLQHSYAKGSTETRFDSTARRFGVKAALFQIDEDDVFLKYQVYQLGDGNGENVDSSISYRGPRVDQLFAKYRWLGVHLGQVDIPTYYGNVFAVSGRKVYELSDVLKAKVKSTLFNEWSRNMPGFKSRLTGSVQLGLDYQPTKILGAALKLHFYPRGLPLEGSPLTSISAYNMHSPGGIVSSLHDKPIAYASFFVTLKTP